jgi:hypothetical protein
MMETTAVAAESAIAGYGACVVSGGAQSRESHGVAKKKKQQRVLAVERGERSSMLYAVLYASANLQNRFRHFMAERGRE